MMLVKSLTLVSAVILIQSCVKFELGSCEDFPSLLSANASMAIILDREYLDDEYDNTLNEVKIIIERVLRENLKNGGLLVTYYSWTKINLRRDFTAVLSVTNCENTWEIFRESREEQLLLIALTDADCPRLPYDEAIMVSCVLNKSSITLFAHAENLILILSMHCEIDSNNTARRRATSSCTRHESTERRVMEICCLTLR